MARTQARRQGTRGFLQVLRRTDRERHRGECIGVRLDDNACSPRLRCVGPLAAAELATRQRARDRWLAPSAYDRRPASTLALASSRPSADARLTCRMASKATMAAEMAFLGSYAAKPRCSVASSSAWR